MDHRVVTLLPRRIPIAPRLDHLADVWTLRGPTDRDLTCAAFAVETGIELRASYTAVDIVATRLFRGPDADVRAAQAANAWRLTLIVKGFRDIER